MSILAPTPLQLLIELFIVYIVTLTMELTTPKRRILSIGIAYRKYIYIYIYIYIICFIIIIIF